MIEKKGNIDPIGDQQKISAAIEAELVAFGLDLERTAVEYLERKNINVDGDLMKSIRSEVEKVKEGFQLQFGAHTPHAIYVHEGTKPHWAPIKPIRQWVRKKLGISGAEKEERNVKFYSRSADRVVEFKAMVNKLDSVARAVQYKIARQGTSAKPFLAVAMRAHINKLAGRIGNAIEGAADAS